MDKTHDNTAKPTALPLATGSPYTIRDYQNAMVEARRERDELREQLTDAAYADADFIDDLATALGIQTWRESWWDASDAECREKILKRIKRLRANDELRHSAPAEDSNNTKNV